MPYEGGGTRWSGTTGTIRDIGAGMSDGTVYAGSLNGKKIYTTPNDAPLTYTFKEVAQYAEQLNAQNFLGHDDWRVPTKDELNVLFNNRAVIGGFDESGSYPDGWYWTSSPYNKFFGWAQRFSDGKQEYGRDGFTSLRCGRG